LSLFRQLFCTRGVKSAFGAWKRGLNGFVLSYFFPRVPFFGDVLSHNCVRFRPAPSL
jgi:hypothetical protein